MTSIFLEYEQNKKIKDNPELLVGQTRYWRTRYWSMNYYFRVPLEYDPGNVFEILDVGNSNRVKYRFINDDDFICEAYVSYILKYSSIVPTNDEFIS